MRRIFPNVPSIYGFSSSAPVGPTAGMLINRYFDRGGRGDFGSGRANASLLKVFGRNSMVRVPGVRDPEPLAAERRQVCRFFDERQDAARKVRFMHGLLRENPAPEAHFSRIEKAFAAFTEPDRSSPAFSQALAEVSADDAARARYLASARAQAQPALRSRMIALAGTLGWLSPGQQRAENVAMINDMLARDSMGFAEVDLVCSLGRDGALDGELRRVSAPASRSSRAAHSAVMACLGSEDAHGQMLRALASPDEKDVQIAQVYFRHRPIEEQQELRVLAREIAGMRGAGAAQVRALDTLARLHISDREIIEELSRAFADTRSVNVQRAIAEVFIRSDPKAIHRGNLVGILREHRLKPPGGGQDLIDVLIARLQSAG
jgi:hypothetical protein